MPNTALRIPSYRRHKPSGQAVVTLGGRDIYLGKYNSAGSRAEYNRLIAEFTANGGTLAAGNDLTVVELAAAFLRHAKTYYKRPDGGLTGEVANYKTLIGRLKTHYGHTRAADFGPLALKTVRRAVNRRGPGANDDQPSGQPHPTHVQMGCREPAYRAERLACLTSCERIASRSERSA